MKKIFFFLCLVMGTYSSLQAQRKLANNETGTVSFIPNSKLVIETKDGDIHVIVPDENDMDAIFTATDQELFDKITEHIKRVSKSGDSVVQIRGTKLGAFSKIYPQQFKLFANKYKKRGLQLNKETSVYAISGYKIVLSKPDSDY